MFENCEQLCKILKMVSKHYAYDRCLGFNFAKLSYLQVTRILSLKLV